MKNALRFLYLACRRILLLPLKLFVRRQTLDVARVKSILVVRWDRIGDMVLTAPVLSALKRVFPDARLTVLASPGNAPLAGMIPEVDEVVVWEGPPRSLWGSGGWRAARALWRRGFDLAVDMLPDWPISSAILAARAAPLRAGFSEGGREVFFNLSSVPVNRSIHFVEANRNLLAGLGVEVDTEPRLSRPAKRETGRTAADQPSAGEPSASETVTGRRLTIGLHPGGFYASQRWPEERWLGLADRMTREEGGLRLVLLLPPDGEEGLARAWESVPGSTGVTRTSDAAALAAEIAQLDALLCNNSGPLHVAGALGVPTLSTMGPTNRARWWPVGSEHEVVVAEGGDVAEIDVEMMWEAWQRLRPRL